MSYNSPLIVSTSSLNPSFSYGGTIAACFTTSVVFALRLAIALALAVAAGIPVPYFAVALAVAIFYTHAWCKATYVRPC